MRDFKERFKERFSLRKYWYRRVSWSRKSRTSTNHVIHYLVDFIFSPTIYIIINYRHFICTDIMQKQLGTFWNEDELLMFWAVSYLHLYKPMYNFTCFQAIHIHSWRIIVFGTEVKKRTFVNWKKYIGSNAASRFSLKWNKYFESVNSRYKLRIGLFMELFSDNVNSE